MNGILNRHQKPNQKQLDKKNPQKHHKKHTQKLKPNQKFFFSRADGVVSFLKEENYIPLKIFFLLAS